VELVPLAAIGGPRLVDRRRQVQCCMAPITIEREEELCLDVVAEGGRELFAAARSLAARKRHTRPEHVSLLARTAIVCHHGAALAALPTLQCPVRPVGG
jgi:hypothetical protein